MKVNLLISLFSAFFFAVTLPSLQAASSSAHMPSHVVSAVHAEGKTATSKHFKKEKRKGGFKNWWKTKVVNRFQNSRFVQRISLGFVGLIVMIVGAMFIVLGIVIPYLGILFLVIGIIIAFIGLLIWVLLSRIGVRIESGDNRDRRAN